jgi:hypothetical protein
VETILTGNGVRVNGRDYEIVGSTGGDAYDSGGETVFDVFDLTDYTYLALSRGTVTGNVITASYEAQGVFKLRSDLVRGENSENVEQGATLHIRPTEDFISEAPAYREHYTLTLMPSDFSEFEESS